MAKPTEEEKTAVICALYELCTSTHCHVPPEAIRRIARLPGDRFTKTMRWLENKGYITCRRHGKGRASCYPTERLLEEARRVCERLWDRL